LQITAVTCIAGKKMLHALFVDCSNS